MNRALVLVAMLSSCAAPAVVQPPDGPFIVLNPPKAAPKPRIAAHPEDSPAAIVRDTEALQDQATDYVVRRDARPAVIDRLTVLTLQTRRAAARARATRRPADVMAARVAADALAALISAQASSP